MNLVERTVQRYGIGMSIRTRLFHTWFLFQRPMTLGVRIAVINRLQQVLLVKHTYVPGWHFPGGGVDSGEDCLSAAHRELNEETGLVLDGPLQLCGVYFNRKTSKRDHVVLYRASYDRVTDLKAAAGEISDVAFFGLHELPDDINPSTRQRLGELFEGRVPSATW